MEVKAEDVKALRERTGAGMMDCKKALAEAGGDFKKAEKLLKEMGVAAAAKRSGRATNEGRVFLKVSGAKAGVLELACETDFVARNQDFVALGNDLAAKIVDGGAAPDAPELVARVTELQAVIKENMALRRATTLAAAPDEIIIGYVHGEGRIGVLVRAKVEKPDLITKAKIRDFVFDTALHIAAYNPLFLAESDVDAAYLKEQEEIFTKQAEATGKPPNVLAGIVKGKLKKHMSEICLLDQPFVKDDKRSVGRVAEDVGKEAGGKVSIQQFVYFRVGEETR